MFPAPSPTMPWLEECVSDNSPIYTKVIDAPPEASDQGNGIYNNSDITIPVIKLIVGWGKWQAQLSSLNM